MRRCQGPGDTAIPLSSAFTAQREDDREGYSPFEVDSAQLTTNNVYTTAAPMASLADRLAPTAGQSRPSSSSGRGGRPTGPARTASAGGRASPRGQQRSAPYVSL